MAMEKGKHLEEIKEKAQFPWKGFATNERVSNPLCLGVARSPLVEDNDEALNREVDVMTGVLHLPCRLGVSCS
ncbi:hypothetical protein A2U01_0003302 [Trifolium medium]|uniref:Uncharacterized protein n=1 Tax=Trifolium medium TaxID=97028 RepID=A0A392M8H9_9FABA|nr:hypothetical protein [Trifolium medium]